MTKLENHRSRYLQDSIPVRLGGLAANLARVASFSKHDSHREAVATVLQESKWFIEWTVAELEIKDAAELVRLQTHMALWQLQSRKRWNDNNWRSELVSQAQKWSERILSMSGLLGN